MLNSSLDTMHKGGQRPIDFMDSQSTPNEHSGSKTENSSIDISESSGNKTEENVTFVTNTDVYGVDIKNDIGLFSNNAQTSSLGTALERPVKIGEETWTVNTAVHSQYDPWTLWQSNAFVKSKLENFAYFKCNLNIRMVPSATPFQYGRLMVNYIPYGNSNEIYYANANTLYGAGGGRIQAYKQYLSTYPITGFIDPTENNVLEMKLPFVYHKNYLPVGGNAAVAKVSLGLLNLVDLNTLSLANSSTTTTMNIAIYCWASDIELEVPTTVVPTAGTSARKKVSFGKKGADEVDEASSSGMISSPASAVSSVAARLSDVPFIGPFAKATQIGAGAVGSIAKIFGFSNPKMIENYTPVTNRLFRNMAYTTVADTCEGLSLDPKQELTIDPRVVGWTAEDEMVISSIVSKEQWLTRGAWTGSVGQFVTAGCTKIILASIVNPVQVRRTGTFSTAPVLTAVQTNPAGHLAQCFTAWSGKIVYRVEVICSKYHSGSLQIQFDPSYSNAALTAATTYSAESNTRNTIIMDIAQTNNLEIEIDYASVQPFLETRGVSQTTFAPNNSETAFALQSIFSKNTDLGILTVSVLNELVAPGDVTMAAGAGAGVEVNLYMRCESDLIFCQPKGGFEDFIFTPTSSEGLTSWSSQILLDSSQESDVLTFYGERVTSIRSLLKRPVAVQYSYATGGGTSAAYDMTYHLPHFAPEVRNGSGRRNCYETYLSPAYMAKRGSTRWKIAYSQSGNYDNNHLLFAERQITTTTNSVATLVTTGSRTVNSNYLASYPSGSSGQQLSYGNYKPCLDVECPYYSGTRFTLASAITNVGITGNENLLINPTMDQILYLRVQIFGFGANSFRLFNYFSVGEDYNLISYQAPPTMWEFS